MAVLTRSSLSTLLATAAWIDVSLYLQRESRRARDRKRVCLFSGKGGGQGCGGIVCFSGFMWARKEKAHERVAKHQWPARDEGDRAKAWAYAG